MKALAIALLTIFALTLSASNIHEITPTKDAEILIITNNQLIARNNNILKHYIKENYGNDTADHTNIAPNGPGSSKY